MNATTTHRRTPSPPAPRRESWVRPLALGLIAAVVAALALGVGANSARGAGLLVADGGLGGRLELREHTVDVAINNGVVVTTVEQVFFNTENRQVEALYTFPVPKGASVADFSMWINGNEMKGEVVEKKRAREIYDSYKQVRRDPALLEQKDYKTFELRIFPIAPQAEQRVRLSYYQELDVDHDWATYVYPLATTAAEGRGADTTVRGRFALRLQARSAVPIVAVKSPSHGDTFVVASHTPEFVEASMEAAEGDLSRDLVLALNLQRPRTGIDVITSRPDGEDGYFQLTLTAGQELAALDTPSDYVFIVDVSGSMANDGKLRLSRGSVDAFIRELSPRDRFDVIAFNVRPTTLFNQLREATEPAIADAAKFLDSQQARGGTVLAPAVQTAYKYADADRPLVVVILSDGMTEQRERSELMQLIRQRPRNARVFAVGVGNEVNRPLLEQVTHEAGGLAAFVSQGDDFERQAQAFRRKLTRPVASNLKVRFDGVDVYDLTPATLPNLYHGSPVRLYGRYRKGGSATVTMDADVLGKALTQQVTVDLPKGDGGNPQIERMWAWRRIDELLKQADAAGSRDSVADEVVRLGEGYAIVTEYTSFLVLENDAEYQRWNIARRAATRIDRDRAARARLQDELDALRLKAQANLGPAAPTGEPAEQLALNTPAAQPQTAANPGATPANPATTPPAGSRDFDFGFAPGTGGGGAIDPVTALLLGGFAAAGALARRRPRGGQR